MADKAVVTQTTLDAIGQAIIAKGGATAPLTPAQMPAAIAAIPSGEQPYWTKQPWINDGWTHVWVKIVPGMETRTVSIRFRYISENAGTIDWGDGSAQTVIAARTTIGVGTYSHTYDAYGVYRIDIYGYDEMNDSSYTQLFVMTAIMGPGQDNRDKCVQAEFGHHRLYGYSNGGFYGILNACQNLHYVKFDKARETGDIQSFCNLCISLREVILPTSQANIGNNVSALSNSKIESIVVPKEISIGQYAFNGCIDLKSVVFEEGTTIVNQKNNALRGIPRINYVEFPSTLEVIAGLYMFYQQGAITEKGITIRCKATTPPELNNSNNFDGYFSRIIVPDGCGDVYRAATNWSSFASIIIEEREVV